MTRHRTGHLRIFATGKPSMIGARVLPMTEEDREWWKLFRARKDRK